MSLELDFVFITQLRSYVDKLIYNPIYGVEN